MPTAKQQLGKHISTETDFWKPTCRCVINRYFLGYEIEGKIESSQDGSRSSQNWVSPRQSRKKGLAEDLLLTYCNLLWLWVIVQGEINKSNYQSEPHLISHTHTCDNTDVQFLNDIWTYTCNWPTHCVVQVLSWKADSHSNSQEIPCLLGTL
jgi:hypothetical protein